MSSFYSGFKSLGESLLKPTISFFGGSKAEPKIEPRQSISEPNPKKSTLKMTIKIPEDLENESLNNSLEYPESSDHLSLPKHKSRNEGLSTSTAASQHSPIKLSHSHTKSLVGWEAKESSVLQEGDPSDLQGTEAPLLFSKGGYDAHIVTKGLNLDGRKMSLGLTKRKGGFVILEKNESPEIKKPSYLRKFSTPQARLSGSFHNFFSKQVEAAESNTFIPQIEEAIEEEVVDPLCGTKAPLVRKQSRIVSGSISHKRIPSNLSIGLSEINGDNDHNYTRAMTMTAKGDRRNFSTIWEDYENQDNQESQDIQELVITEKLPQFPQTTKHRQINSFFDFSPEDSKREDSVIIMPDQTSDLEIDFGDEEINNSDNSCVQVENPVTQVKERLIQEYKAIQKQQLTSKGIYVVPTSDPFVWNCLVFIKGGYYENAKFKFQMHIPDTYPSGSIKVYASTKVYHPLINIETGELDLKLCDQKDENKIAKVLTFMKSIFNESKYLEKQTSFNQEAGLKFSQNPYYFKVKSKDSVKTTQKNLLNEDTEKIPEILNRANIIKEAVTIAAKQSTNFDDKVQSLIASIKQKVKAD